MECVIVFTYFDSALYKTVEGMNLAIFLISSNREALRGTGIHKATEVSAVLYSRCHISIILCDRRLVVLRSHCAAYVQAALDKLLYYAHIIRLREGTCTGDICLLK
jgi:hypothetical protein